MFWKSWPGIIQFFFWLVIVIVAIILLSLLVHWAGGADLHLHIGHFHFDIGFS